MVVSFSVFVIGALSISVILPCTQSHLQFLPQLLFSLKNQTLLPTEVVISISSLEEQDHSLLDKLQTERYSFILKIVRSYKRQYAGENRNIAIENSSGELIICQDADDIPHPQRIEAIHSLYYQEDFDLLLHLYLKYDFPSQGKLTTLANNYQSLKFSQYNLDVIKLNTSNFFKLKRQFLSFFLKFTSYKERNKLFGIHFGNCAFKRTVFDSVRYSNDPTGQDLKFCTQVVENFRSCFLTNLPLVYFIKTRSTYKERISFRQEYALYGGDD
ncbi:MAG: glycosyltransferase [Candidatus Paceibacterota bacterium]